MTCEVLQDDPSIADDAVLWRGVSRRWLVWDSNRNEARPSSAVFKTDEMSVLLADCVQRGGRTPESVLASFDAVALVSLTAGSVRAESQVVRRDPEPDEPCHALVLGDKNRGSVAKRLLRASTLLVPPSDEEVQAVKARSS